MKTITKFSGLLLVATMTCTNNTNTQQSWTWRTRGTIDQLNLHSGGLFKFVKEVKVTPVDSFNGGDFVRIGYVPGRDRIVVSFRARLAQAAGGCNGTHAFGYREYTVDMVETGKEGVISCKAGPDIGGLFAGNDFYAAAMGRDSANTVDGWWVAKYDAVTWTSLVSTFFHPLATGEENGDPMLALVNGQIDISALYRSDPNAPRGPFVSDSTHHQFFTTDLQFVSERVLSDTAHINLSSMIAANGITNFVTGTALLGNMIVMQYDSNWNYLGTKTLKQKSAAPEGVAFDGTRFYVSYLDVPCTTFPCYDNVRLAAFDSSWNLLDDIAVTSFTSQEKQPNRPTLTLWNGRIYVAWDQLEDTSASSGANNPDSADIQVHVSIYELTSGPSSVEPAFLQFDTVTVGCSRSEVVTVKNLRCDPLQLAAVVSNIQDFSINPVNAIVLPQDSAVLTVRFAPLSVGNKSVQVILMYNQTSKLDTVLISATATGTGSEIAITDSFGLGWQLISVPVEAPCPYLLPGSFLYQGAYRRVDTLVLGKGYWNKLITPKLSYAGLGVTVDTVPVAVQWNIIGSISEPVPVANITSKPPGIVTSQFFGYQETYFSTNTIFPGRAYWVKVNQSGELILSSSALASASNRIIIVATDELPPPPPDGALSNPKHVIPNQFLLMQNYPNPFNPSTTISYQLPTQSHVTLKILDVLGREVATLVNGEQTAGYKSATWEASGFPSGIYFYKLTAGSFTQVRKLLLLK